MDGEQIGEIIAHKDKVIRERVDRDKFYLMANRATIMKDLASDSNEWITEEVKEQLEMVELVKKLDNVILVSYAKSYEKRIKEIKKNFKRQIITPMTKLSKRQNASVTDAHHYTKITHAMHSCNDIILELLEIRVQLDSLTRIDEKRAELCPEPNLSSEEAPKGMYS